MSAATCLVLGVAAVQRHRFLGGLALGAGWAINLTVAEYVIARSRNGRLKLSTALQEA